MEEDSDPRSLLDLETDIDSMVAALESETPSAPNINKIQKEEEKEDKQSYKSLLKNREILLSGVDDFLISSGARLILFLPIVVVFLYGLAQSFRGSDPQWWEGSVRELFLDLSFYESVYLLSLVIMVADLLLLFVLHYLLWVTKRIFQIETSFDLEFETRFKPFTMQDSHVNL